LTALLLLLLATVVVVLGGEQEKLHFFESCGPAVNTPRCHPNS
jgi:hypothetical protein